MIHEPLTPSSPVVRTIPALLGLALFLGVPLAAAGAGPPPEAGSPPIEVPARIEISTPAGVPFWVSAEEAVTEGRLRPEVFTEFHRNRLLDEVQQLRELRGRSGDPGPPADRPATQEDCTTFTVSGGKGPYLEGKEIGLESLFEWAEVVLVGRITGRAEGFLGGFAASLLQLATQDVLKSPEDVEFSPIAYFDYPLTSIEVGGELLCTRPPSYPKVPESGRRALVFGQRILAEDPTLVRAGGALVVFEDAKGEVVLPWLEGEVVSGPPWEEIVQRIQEIAAQHRPER